MCAIIPSSTALSGSAVQKNQPGMPVPGELLFYYSHQRLSYFLSLAKSHFKQPPEAEIAPDSVFPSGSYGDQRHFQVWNLLV
jgi:hypothetical protein